MARERGVGVATKKRATPFLGRFHFGYVHGHMDCRLTTRDERPALEFAWEGNDEMEHTLGRGWVVVEGGRIEGMLQFHGGDSSAFRATRKKRP